MIKFVGDIYPTHPIELPFESCDYLVCNFEAAYGVSLDLDKSKVALYTDYHWANDYQSKSGQLVVSLANNHILDGGNQGVCQLMNYLEENDILSCGLSTRAIDFNQPLVIEDEGRKIALISYVHLSGMDKYQLESDFQIAIFSKEDCIKRVQLAKNQKVDQIVCLIHWGEEEAPAAGKMQKSLAHWMIDQGVDLIIGHHTHSIQEKEVYKEKEIYYSIGNFHFPDFKVRAFAHEGNPDGIIYRKRQLSWNKEGLVITLTKDGKTLAQRVTYQKESLKLDARPWRYRKRFFNKGILYGRKLWSMIYSNTFTEEGILDWTYFKNEYRLLKNKRRSS